MAPTLDELLDGLHARFALVPAFVRLNSDNVNIALLKHEPTAMHSEPTVYTLFDGATYGPPNPTLPITYRLLSRLVVSWQNPSVAEANIRTYVPALIATVNATPEGMRLGNLAGFNRGSARIVSADAGFLIISGTTYRIVDLLTEITIK